MSIKLQRLLYRVARLLGGARLTTAQYAVQALVKDGVGQENVRGEHLAFIYSSMIPWKNVPDFSVNCRTWLPEVSGGYQKNVPVSGVIVETREHPALEFVVNQVALKLQIPILLIHGLKNREFILSTTISRLIDKGKVVLIPLTLDSLSASQYNALLLTKEFWQFIGGEKVLVFQTDSVLCEQSDYALSDFLTYDYIGSEWFRFRPQNFLADGGVGGLSVRDSDKMISCLDRFPPCHWCGGEDGYFAFHLDVMGAKIGRGIECSKFSTQFAFQCRSFGAHCITDLDLPALQRFLRYAPEAGQIALTLWPPAQKPAIRHSEECSGARVVRRCVRSVPLINRYLDMLLRT